MAKNKRKMVLQEASEQKGQRFAANPFVGDWRPPTKTKYRRTDLDKGDGYYNAHGEKLSGIKLDPYERDAGRFVKQAHEVLPDLWQLSSTARSVLDYAMYNALVDNDIVWLSATEGAEFCHFNQTKSFYNGLSELILQGFLARTERLNYYFLNPRKWFNGSRANRKSIFKKPSQQ